MAERPASRTSLNNQKRIEAIDWGWMYADAVRALRARHEASGALAPLQVIRSVFRVLPRPVRGEWLTFVRRQGWHRRSNVVSCVGFESLSRSQWRLGGGRELLRLAVFGLPGQGKMTDQKHRDALFQRYSAEIMRESQDLARLQRTAQRVLGNREVTADVLLVGMLRAVVSQREAELRMASQVKDTSAPAQGPVAGTEFFTKEQVVGMLQRLGHKFEDQVAHFEELAAGETLSQIKNLAKRYPVHISEETPKRFEAAFARFRARCAEWRATIDQLAERGVKTAEAGDEHKAAWIIRRLHAIHAMRGALLHEAHLDELCRKIQKAEDSYEEQEAAHLLIAREKEIAKEVKGLAAVVRQFHQVAREQGPESPAFRVAAERYRKAVQEVVQHDQDWLTGVFMELEDLVSEMHDTTGEAENQINEFVNRVRTAILQTREEIRQIHAEQLDQFPKTDPGAKS